MHTITANNRITGEKITMQIEAPTMGMAIVKAKNNHPGLFNFFPASKIK